MFKLSLALMGALLLAGCGGHPLASCSGPTFALPGPSGHAFDASPDHATVLPAPAASQERPMADAR